MIETTEYIEFGPLVFPIRLTPDHFGGGVTATMAGFGQTTQEPIVDNKQYLDMETMTNADCRRFFSRLPFNAVRIFDSNICLFHPAGRGGCGGDSGASITVNQISVGIASWIGGPCDIGTPDVFARTANYYYWIRNVTEINRIEEWRKIIKRSWKQLSLFSLTCLQKRYLLQEIVTFDCQQKHTRREYKNL